MSKKLLIVLAALMLGICGFVSAYLMLSATREDSSTRPSQAPEQTQADAMTKNLACIAALPLRQRIAQKIMAAGYSAYLDDEITPFAEASIGGVIMMDEASTEQIAAFRRAMPIAPFVAVDQEGGTVQRYRHNGPLPGAEVMAASFSVDGAHQQYLTDSKHLKEVGITTNFAPAVDVLSHMPDPLPGRIYSTDPSVVAEYASASIKAAQAAGITPVIKHFPGLGSATGNTDFAPATTDPLATLRSRDLLPYERLAPLHPDVMVGNMVVPDLTDGQPAIWSERAVRLVRSLGYENAVVYSDSLTARAIPGNIEEAALKAWAAGVDVAVIVQPDNETANLAALFSSIISGGETAVDADIIQQAELNRSVLRILTRKRINPCAPGSS